ncbi:MAG: hypothetical protein M0Z47_02480 [Actinomycetota bacterium]|nr:hypothetical protein [Actinomycetota bacterium]
MTCPKCHQGTTVEINLRIATHVVTLRSCSMCESRWWRADDIDVEVGEVLELASAMRR